MAIGWLAAVLAVSLGLRLAWLGHPAGGLLLDELFYVSAAHRILRLDHIPKDPYPYAREGLDPLVEHPVGGKLIVAASISLLGDNAYGWRLPSVVFGTLVILLTFLLAVKLTASPPVGLVAATLLALDPLMLIHSRIAMLEIFVMTFLLAGVYAYLSGRAVWAGVMLAAAVCCKLTGLSGIATILVFECAGMALDRARTGTWPMARLRPLAVTFGVFAAALPAIMWVLNRDAALIENPFDHLFYMVTHLSAWSSSSVTSPVPKSAPWEWLLNQREIVYLNQQGVVVRGLYNPFLIFATIPVVLWASVETVRRGSQLALLVLAMVTSTYATLVVAALQTPRPSVPVLFSAHSAGDRDRARRLAAILTHSPMAHVRLPGRRGRRIRLLLSVSRYAMRAIAALSIALVAGACVDAGHWERTVAAAGAQRDAGQYELAERTLLDALEQAEALHRLHPYQLVANTELARLYFKMRDYERARLTVIRLLEKLETLHSSEHPGIGSLYADLGRACDQLGRFDEARDHYRKALPAALREPVQNELDYLYADMAVNASYRKAHGEADEYFAKAEETAQRLNRAAAIGYIRSMRSKLRSINLWR